jgi:cytidine deaminase
MPGHQQAHCLVVGVSGFGKSHYCHAWSARAKAHRRLVLVYEPHAAYRWACHFQTSDFAYFMDVCAMNRNALCFVEEAHLQFTNRAEHAAHFRLLREGRHNGHDVVLITQRYRDIPPAARDQCQHLVVFRQSRKSCEALEDETSEKQFRMADSLRVGEHLVYHAGKGICLERPI